MISITFKPEAVERLTRSVLNSPTSGHISRSHGGVDVDVEVQVERERAAAPREILTAAVQASPADSHLGLSAHSAVASFALYGFHRVPPSQDLR